MWQVVARRLPPTMTEEEFLEAVSPLAEYDYFSYVPADKSLGAHAFSRAYINFKNTDDVFTFRDRFDSYVFVDKKGILLILVCDNVILKCQSCYSLISIQIILNIIFDNLFFLS